MAMPRDGGGAPQEDAEQAQDDGQQAKEEQEQEQEEEEENAIQAVPVVPVVAVAAAATAVEAAAAELDPGLHEADRRLLPAMQRWLRTNVPTLLERNVVHYAEVLVAANFTSVARLAVAVQCDPAALDTLIASEADRADIVHAAERTQCSVQL